MKGLSSSTVIQTTWRCPLRLQGQKEIRIAFKSNSEKWVSFLLNGQTGTIKDIQGFAPEHQIPNWYSNTPFTEWSITIDSLHRIELNGKNVTQYKWDSHSSSLTELLEICSPQAICALWTGKYGYTILTP